MFIFIQLFEAVQANPGSLIDKVLKAENNCIKEINDLPTKYRNVDLINLNQNNIKSFRGIAQFASLKKLILSNNEVNPFNENEFERNLYLDIKHFRSLSFNDLEKS